MHAFYYDWSLHAAFVGLLLCLLLNLKLNEGGEGLSNTIVSLVPCQFAVHVLKNICLIKWNYIKSPSSKILRVCHLQIKWKSMELGVLSGVERDAVRIWSEMCLILVYFHFTKPFFLIRLLFNPSKLVNLRGFRLHTENPWFIPHYPTEKPISNTDTNNSATM